MNKLVIVLLSVVLLCGCPATVQPDKEVASQQNRLKADSVAMPVNYQEFIQSGDVFPFSDITDINGQTVDLGSTDKRKLVILFATWCSDSNRLLQAMNQSPLLDDSQIEIIAIAREEDEILVRKWRDENNIKTPLASDSDRRMYQQFASGGIPRIITVSRDNKVIKMNLAEGESQLEQIVW